MSKGFTVTVCVICTLVISFFALCGGVWYGIHRTQITSNQFYSKLHCSSLRKNSLVTIGILRNNTVGQEHRRQALAVLKENLSYLKIRRKWGLLDDSERKLNQEVIERIESFLTKQ